MNKLFFIVVLLLSFAKGYGQKIDYPLNNRVTINYQDYMVYAHFTRDERTIHIDDDKYYYWFAYNDIKKTRGGYDGKILHGLYTAFYMNKNLKEKGKFHYGLKKGEWKEWYRNGELKGKGFYKKGERNKSFTTYYNNGRVKQKGTYKKGLLNKKLKSYDSSGVWIKTERYKKGVLVPQKVRAVKVKKRRSLFNKKKKNSPAVDSLGMPFKSEKKKFFRNPLKRKSVPVQSGVEQKKPKKEKKVKDKSAIRVRKLRKVVPADTEKSNI
ncbi:MAG: hypothetical protein H7282_14760 [Cytophagaceae bacterium]|nr:hypothetical protein [Cytophagaceae bacterium]